MPASIISYGTTYAGNDAHLYVLSNRRGMCVGVTDVGASLVLARVPDAGGSLLDVALGHQGPRGYEHNPMGFGATVGRNANRITNACFELEGTLVQLVPNEGTNSLHSGPDMWFERLWNLVELNEDSATLSLTSPAGDQGFPEDVQATASYALSENNRLTIRYDATASGKTIINMTNHTYWNLNGHASGTVLDHVLVIDAEHYLPTNDINIPLGKVAPVAETPFDLRGGRMLRDVLEDLPRGYDHNFCLAESDELAHAARLSSKRSGITMDVLTDAPGVQVYMAGWLDPMTGKDGAPYGRFSGVALETQHWPDAIHHPSWPSVVYGPERPFSQTTVFAFSAEEDLTVH